MTNIEKAISILESIPDEDFMTEWFSNQNTKKCCSVTSDNTESYGNNCIKGLGLNIDQEVFLLTSYHIVQVNDDPNWAFPQDTPKARVLALLNKAKTLNNVKTNI
jgi:hypothetical protein